MANRDFEDIDKEMMGEDEYEKELKLKFDTMKYSQMLGKFFIENYGKQIYCR